MKTVHVVTTSRADFGIYLPVIRALDSSSAIDLSVIATGSHLSPFLGNTVSYLDDAGYAPIARIEALVSSDSPQGTSKSIGLGVIGFADQFARVEPDLLILLGDRFDMLPAALAAMPFRIPIAHIHGGEVTEGAYDDGIRHAITKLSHIHFTSTSEYQNRVIQMGEEPWRVHAVGAPALDNISAAEDVALAELESFLGLSLEIAPLLVTFHPETIGTQVLGSQVDALLGALKHLGLPVVFTMPNADTGNDSIRKAIDVFVQNSQCSVAFESLGIRRYYALMKVARAMLGNSSSGIIEAASFGLPVVNIGDRQAGRIRGANVIDVRCEKEAIVVGVGIALSSEFRDTFSGQENVYGDGKSSGRILNVIEALPERDVLIKKRFIDLD